MTKPVLLVMAAGMGSRYGGLKQMDPITDKGEIIIDFSLYDAMMAGFEKAVFIIREELEEDFRQLIMPKAGKYMDVEFVYQKIEDMPGITQEVPPDRKKPWGTAHAIMSARDVITGPFAVINADDYYGPWAFSAIYEYLSKAENKDGVYDFCMVSYMVKNTLTEHGTVARGVCQVNQKGQLVDIVERLQIKRQDEKIVYLEEDEKTWTAITEDTPVSMNLWGFTGDMMGELEKGFADFFENAKNINMEKAEYQIPEETDKLIKEGKASVQVLASPDRWFGVTYKDDKPVVMDALQAMKDKGLYPEKLFG